MKASLAVLILGAIAIPAMHAWSFLPQKEASKPDDSLVVVPTDPAMYEKYVCLSNSNGTKLLVPGSCNSYYTCLDKKAILNVCQSPTPYYDAITKSCTSKSNCEERDILVPSGPAGCKGLCCGKPAGLYVVPNERTHFIFCKDNVGILHTCCGGEEFNPITKACDVPANCP